MDINEMLPFLIPLIIVDLALGIFSAIHVVRHRKYRFGNMYIWLVLVLLLQFFGPILYFVIGKGEQE